MPIYEYRCEPCAEAFEAFLSTSTEQAVCPKCQGTELTRLMSMFASGRKDGVYKQVAPAGPAPKKTGGCGGGCACH